jgi:hypothetical protein
VSQARPLEKSVGAGWQLMGTAGGGQEIVASWASQPQPVRETLRGAPVRLAGLTCLEVTNRSHAERSPFSQLFLGQSRLDAVRPEYVTK